MESNVPDKVRSSKHKEKCFSYGSCAWICQFSSQKIFQKFFDWNFSFCIVSVLQTYIISVAVVKK
jgi:hypothetical protein